MLTRWVLDTTPISIHSPRMGRDAILGGCSGRGRDFNPLSPHGERHYGHGGSGGFANFNPLSPHGERRDVQDPLYHTTSISIHSPRMGRDVPRLRLPRSRWNFNPLSPHGERPLNAHLAHRCPHFNPLSPHGERPTGFAASLISGLFQSTLPAWGETFMAGITTNSSNISIHSPRMGRDVR